MEYESQYANQAGAARMTAERSIERSIAVDMQYGTKLGIAEVDERGELQHITDRINECIDRASSNAERVSILADRIKGATPENKLDGATLASGGNGAIADIHSRIDILTNALCATGSGIARIERL